MAARLLALGAAMAAIVSAQAPSNGTTDACVSFCESMRDACNQAATDPNAPNHPLCASWFSQCVGYSPYPSASGQVYVEPTACSSLASSALPAATGTPDSCAQNCLQGYYACSTASGPAAGYCAYKLSACLGKSPFFAGVYYQPLTCLKEDLASTMSTAVAPPATTTAVVTALTTYCPGPTTLVVNNQTITVTAATTLTITNCPCTITTPVQPTGKPAPPASCVDTCKAAFSACQNAPGANMSFCAAKFSGCLGYNPWGSGQYVTPTACASTPTAPPVVPTAGAGRVVPGALVALGAMALL